MPFPRASTGPSVSLGTLHAKPEGSGQVGFISRLRIDPYTQDAFGKCLDELMNITFSCSAVCRPALWDCMKCFVWVGVCRGLGVGTAAEFTPGKPLGRSGLCFCRASGQKSSLLPPPSQRRQLSVDICYLP